MLGVFQELCLLVEGFESISLPATTKTEEYCYLILRLQSFCYSSCGPKGYGPTVFEKDSRLETSAFVVFLRKLIGKP